MMAVNSGVIGIRNLSLWSTFGKKDLQLTPFTAFSHCVCHFLSPSSFTLETIVDIGILSADIDIFVRCSCVDTQWQQYSTHLHTQTIHRTTQLTNLVGRLSGIQTQSGQTKINDDLCKSFHLIGKSADRAPSLRVVPWYLPYG